MPKKGSLTNPLIVGSKGRKIITRIRLKKIKTPIQIFEISKFEIKMRILFGIFF